MKYILIATLTILSLIRCSGQAQPNVVLILADDLGYGDLGCYGHKIISTPYLDQLANDGISYTQAYSASPLCSPSRAALLTGRTPYRTGIKSWIPIGQEIYLHKEEQTIASLLKDKGYQTFLSGKWHLNGALDDSNHPQPSDHGFDRWTSLHAYALPNHKNPNNVYRDGRHLVNLKGYTADIFADQALAYLDERDKEKPFFLYLSMAEPHSEIASPESFTDRYAEYTSGQINQDSLYDRGPGEYYANVEYMDDQIGKVLHYLKEQHLEENTIVVFMSDNGPVTDQWRYWYEVNLYGDTGGLRGRKADLFDGGIRVPFIIKYPGSIKPQTVSHEPVIAYDIMPTISKLIQLDDYIENEIDGIDISPTWKGETLSREEPLFWAFHTREYDEPNGYNYAARQGEWKLIANPDTEAYLLYNLSTDPNEVRDVSNNQPEIVKELSSFVNNKIRQIANDPINPRGDEERIVTLLYTNDIESVYDPIDAYWIDTLTHIGGIPYLATLMKKLEHKAVNPFKFDAGDIFTGALSKATLGLLPFDVYSDIGYDAITIGNHEFEYGYQQLLKGIDHARFPVLNANIYYEGTDIRFGKPYTIVEKNGIRIGVIGSMGEEAFYNTIYKGTRKGLEVRNPIPTVQQLVDDLRPHVDMIVALTHQNKSAPMQSDKEIDPDVQRGFDEDYAMAGAINGLDVILGGHSDNGLWSPVIHPQTGTIIGITFGQSKQIGEMVLRLKEEGGVELISGRLVPVKTEQLSPDKEIRNKIEQVRHDNPELTKVIGQNTSTGFRKYYKESNLGNFMADILKSASGAKIAMINPGALRSDLDVGPITVEEIVNIYPFLDNIEMIELTGLQLKEAIEYSLSLNYGMMQFSGLTVEYDLTRSIGNRIVNASVDGEAIGDKKSYTFATTSFVARGGDGFEVLTRGRRLRVKEIEVKGAMKKYIMDRGTILLPELGRLRSTK
jgi:arylsulfatase A-like enzyme